MPLNSKIKQTFDAQYTADLMYRVAFEATPGAGPAAAAKAREHAYNVAYNLQQETINGSPDGSTNETLYQFWTQVIKAHEREAFALVEKARAPAFMKKEG